ncbi:hypothetical protein C8J56DRAFT_1170067 [Mycena floridula]|nr:hypothetical protein C8J56DRAFT_1170067 [Mycena floridula]
MLRVLVQDRLFAHPATRPPRYSSFSARSIQTPNPVHPTFAHSVIPSLIPTTSHEYLSENLSRRSIIEPTSSRWQALFTASDMPETRSLEETCPSTASNSPVFTIVLVFCGADVVKQILEIRESGNDCTSSDGKGKWLDIDLQESRKTTMLTNIPIGHCACVAFATGELEFRRHAGQQRRPSAATRDFTGRGNPSYLDNEDEGPLFTGSNGQVFPKILGSHR